MGIRTNRFLVQSIVVLVALFISLPAEAVSIRARYEEGVSLIERRRYDDAIEHFREMLADTRTSPYSDNCQFWIGECYYRMEQYEKAIFEYDRTLLFPNTNKGADAMYKLGRCYQQLNQNREAIDIFRRFLAEYPDSRLYSQVMTRLENLGGL